MRLLSFLIQFRLSQIGLLILNILRVRLGWWGKNLKIQYYVFIVSLGYSNTVFLCFKLSFTISNHSTWPTVVTRNANPATVLHKSCELLKYTLLSQNIWIRFTFFVENVRRVSPFDRQSLYAICKWNHLNCLEKRIHIKREAFIVGISMEEVTPYFTVFNQRRIIRRALWQIVFG